MAITAVGFTGTVNELQWAQLMELAMGGNAAQIVNTGLDPSSGGATRIINVTAGSGACCGVKFDNSATVAVTLNANGSTNNRLDIIVAEVNWTADTVTITKITGTTSSPTPTLPSLTQTAGSSWQIPLAVVTVRPGVTNIAAADVADVRPFRPSMKLYLPAVDVTSVGQAQAPKTISSRTIPDPGWPHRIRVSGGCEFTGVAGGRGVLSVSLDGAFFTGGRAPSQNTGPAMLRTETSAVLTGSHVVVMTMEASGMTQALNSQASTATGLTIEVVPA